MSLSRSFFDVEFAADLLSVTKQTVAAWIDSGRLTPVSHDKNGQPLVGTLLILSCYIEHHIVITIAPILWQTFRKTLWTFCQQSKEYVWPLSDNMPCFIAPRVGFLNKEVGGKTNIERHPRWQLKLSVAPALDGHGEILRTENVRSVKTALAVKKIHIAMRTALTHLVASMPGIPYNHSNNLLTFPQESHFPLQK